MINFSEAEVRSFNSNLKVLFKVLLQECPSTAHTLLVQMLQYGFFITSCETLINEIGDDELLCGLIVSSLCETETLQFHLPCVFGLLKSSFRKNLCLLLLATDNISLLQTMIEEDKKEILSNSKARLHMLMEQGIQPVSAFLEMAITERHFVLQILDLINSHLDELPALSKCSNIPSFFWPLLLLKNWDNTSLTDELMLQLIEKCKQSTQDKTITRIAYILEWCINFSKWREQQDSSESKERKMQDLLEQAVNHSVLYIINNTTDLSEANWSQIRELIIQGKSKSEASKSWDLILFNAYCILMLVIRAIIASTEIDQMAKAQKVKIDDLSFLNDSFNALYNEEVTVILSKVKDMLQSLYPLSFRLEVLENIFGLIFITYEDVRKVSYFLNGVIDCEKFLDKISTRNKFVSVEKCSSVKLGKLYSSHVSTQVSEVIEEESLNKKLKLKGFMCKKYILRDLIYLVKDCLEKLEKDQSDEACDEVPCSIKPTQMENRLDRYV